MIDIVSYQLDGSLAPRRIDEEAVPGGGLAEECQTGDGPVQSHVHPQSVRVLSFERGEGRPGGRAQDGCREFGRGQLGDQVRVMRGGREGIRTRLASRYPGR